jgi:hypothetical protein
VDPLGKYDLKRSSLRDSIGAICLQPELPAKCVQKVIGGWQFAGNGEEDLAEQEEASLR